MPGTLFYEILGECDYATELEKLLDSIVEEFSFEGKRRSEKVYPSAYGMMINDIINSPFGIPLSPTPSLFNEVKKAGDRKVFIICSNGLYDVALKNLLKELNIYFLSWN